MFYVVICKLFMLFKNHLSPLTRHKQSGKLVDATEYSTTRRVVVMGPRRLDHDTKTRYFCQPGKFEVKNTFKNIADFLSAINTTKLLSFSFIYLLILKYN